MKLASLKNGRDGTLIVVDKKLSHAVEVPGIAASLLQALEDWPAVQPKLELVYGSINAGNQAAEYISRVTAETKVQQRVVDVPAMQKFLAELSATLENGRLTNSFELNLNELAAPLPRAPQFVDGSA
ncbi:MAG: hypothetical protein KGK44_11800 [Gammaproteobacteria bacterium]|nr:hypothetical protein [Gammaproteobacteria bacterium]